MSIGPVKTRGWKTSLLPSKATSIPTTTIPAVIHRRASNMAVHPFLLRPQSGYIFGNSLDNPLAKALPGKRLSPSPSRIPHADELHAVSERPIDVLGQSMGLLGFNNETLHARFHQVGR